ncbi:hemagglutinin repeat-containing protein [Janthinobacterium violaceinigrum]|nr:hemagglutinin repeat-containing protein [Janthinobacterium violaceinigrum]
MAIGGYLDGNRIATGWAGSVTNASATIEALGSLNLGASQVNVLNNHLVFEEGREITEKISEYQTVAPTDGTIFDGTTYAEGAPGVSILGKLYSPGNYMLLRTPDGKGFNLFWHREVTRTTKESVVMGSDPGRIISGGNMKIGSSAIVNDNSHILAGGALDIDRAILQNKEVQGKKTVHEVGTVTKTELFATAQNQMSRASVQTIDMTIMLPSNTPTTARIEQFSASIGQGAKPASVSVAGVNAAVEGIGRTTATVNTSSVIVASVGVESSGHVNGKEIGYVDGEGAIQKTDRAGNSASDAVVGVAPTSQLNAAKSIAADSASELNHVSTVAAGLVAGQSAALASGGNGINGSTRTGDAARAVAVDTVSGARVNAASGGGQYGGGVDATLLARSSAGTATVVPGGNGSGGAHGGAIGQAGDVGRVTSTQLSGIAGIEADPHTGLTTVTGAGITGDQVRGTNGPGGIADASTIGRAAEIATLASSSVSGVDGAQAPGAAELGSVTRVGIAAVPVQGGNGPGSAANAGTIGQGGAVGQLATKAVAAAEGAQTGAATGLSPLKDVVIAASTGSAANAGAVSGEGQVRMNGITQVKLGNPSTRAQVVRTTGSSLQIPNASLYQIRSAPSSRYLVETDPRFASYREWTGSDYLLSQIKNDPSVTQKRLGDGFYEQRLVREQIAELTGQRFVGDYTSDEQQYKALMDQGAAFAKQWDLRPGIALTAEQMAGLTSDIVWLVEQDVVLADGSTQKVLAPQVYVRVREGDIDGQGGLLAGKEVNLNLEGDLVNSGTIAGRTIVKLNADNIENMGGRISGDAISATARNDLNNIGGTISANSELLISAGRDVNVKTSTQSLDRDDGKNSLSLTSLDRLAGLYVTGDGTVNGGNLLVSAGRDVNIAGASIANTANGGGIGITAGRDIAVTTVSSHSEQRMEGYAGRYTTDSSVKETVSNISAAGDIRMSAGDNILLKAAGVHASETLQLTADRNIDMSTARDTETHQSWYGSGSTKNSSQGSELGGKQIVMLAGNDINNVGGQVVAADKLIAGAGRDINVVTTTVNNASERWTDNISSSTTVGSTAGMYVTGTDQGHALVVQAGRDVTVTGGVIANAGVNGQTSVIAGNNLTLNTVTVASTHNDIRNADNYSKQSKTGEVGSQIMGAGNVNLQAGHDLTARAADVQAGGTLGLLAGNDISLVNGFQNEVSDTASKSTKEGFWNKTTTTKHDVVDTTTAIGTSLGGSSVTVQAGHDLQVTGSSILSDDATRLLAGNNITIDAATNTVYELHHSSTKKSGFMSSGGIGFSYGTKTTTVDQERDATLQSGEARSSIGATGGALTMVAGNNVTIGGSDILAATDLDIIGKSVTIKPGQDNEKGKFEVKTTQDGLTLALGGSVISAIQTLQTMSTAASTAKDGRVTAMAAATAAMAANGAAKEMMKEGPSISISLTAGHSESIQTQNTASTTHSGSVLTGNNINITALGGGKDSNVNILGSDLNAKNDIRLHADNNVNLLAAQDTESQHSKSSSLSASVGVKAIVSTQGTSFGFTASVSGSKGHEDGDGTTQLNTHVNAGDKLVITSGGDTNIKGAVVSANQVIADIKGNLNLESLQDLAKFDSKSQSISASGTVGIGASFSGSYSQSNMHNDYASVQEQSGIRAGNGGFQIKVGGNTDLKGAVISATEAGKLNSSLTTATLTHSDIANHAISKGSSVGVSGGFSVAGKETEENKNLTNVGGKGGTTAGLPSMVALSENATSTTRSGISGGTLLITDDAAQRAATGKGADEAIADVNRDVTTGVDSSGKIGNNFDKAKLQATMDVTAAFAAAAAEKLGTYASEKLEEATALAEEAYKLRETDPERSAELTRQSVELTENWKEGGLARVALHTAIGGLAGGTNGALGAGAAALSTDSIAKQLKQLDMPETLRDALTLAAGAAVGAAAGGATGAAAAANEVANNYLKHEEILELGQQEAACDGGKGNADACEKANKLRFTSADRDAELAACTGNNGAKCEELRSLVLGSVMGIVQQRDGHSDENYIVESNRTFDIAISSGSTDGNDPRNMPYDPSIEGIRIFTSSDGSNITGQGNADLYPPTRSLIGDMYRASMRETLDSSNSWDVRAGYGTTALISAIPGMYNDMSSGFLNSPNNLIGGSNYMVDGWKDGNWNLFSAGLMRAGIGVLDLGGGAFVLKGSITANLKAQEYAAYSAYSRSTYQASATAENQILLNQNPRIIAGAEPSSLLQQPGAVDNLLYGARVGEGLPGAQGVVIPGRPTTDQLANLSAKHEVEFGVTYTLGNGKGGSGGFYTLYSGTKKTVSIGEISGDKMLISHTHPDGAAFASGYYEIVNGREVFKGDQGVLELLQKAGSPQRTSTIIPLERSDGVKAPPFKFSVEDSNLDYGISNGTIVPRR